MICGEKISDCELAKRSGFRGTGKCERTSLGTNVWRLVSMGRIKAKERYDMPMQLYIGRRLESRFISPPQIGKFQSDSSHTLREVCYIKEQ